MNNLSLRNKLTLSYAGLIILLIVVFSVSIVTLQNVQNHFSAVTRATFPIVAAIEDIKFAGSRLISSSNEYLLDLTLNIEGTDQELGQIEEARTQYNNAFNSYRALIGANFEPGDTALLASIETTGQKLLEAVDKILVMQSSERLMADIIEVREDIEPAESDFLSAVNTAILAEEEELASSQRDVDAAVKSAVSLSSVLIVVAGVATVLGVIYISRSVLRPLSNLSAIASLLKEGHLAVRSEIVSGDEIGQFAATFNAMAEAIEYRDKVQIAKLEDQLQETEAARAQAERSDQVKSAFLASMSHELRTPLNAVINFTLFVVDGDTGPVNEQQEELLKEVVSSAQHLLNLINDVLDMSKIEAGSLNLFIENNIDLNSLINSMTSTGRSLLKDKPIHIETAVDSDLPLIQGDRQRILQILLNLMSNACKFTETGEITVTAHRSSDELLISVADTGPGIAPEDQSLVFEAFKQTQTGLRKGGGTGLGMPIAKNLAEAHGGRLWLESTPGKGATFYFVLPIKSHELVSALA